MVAPEDFFKTIGDKEGSRKEGALERYIEKVVNKYFAPSCVHPAEVRKIMRDTQISHTDKQLALREASEGILRRVHFFNEKTDMYSLVKKGTKHEVVKELMGVMEEQGCDIVVFPVYKMGHWVAHVIGTGDEADKSPRIVMMGDGIAITIQSIASFCGEHVIN